MEPGPQPPLPLLSSSLCFSSESLAPEDTCRLNDFRAAMNEVLTSPEQETAEEARRHFEQFMAAIEHQRQGGLPPRNGFLPAADHSIAGEQHQAVARIRVFARPANVQADPRDLSPAEIPVRPDLGMI